MPDDKNSRFTPCERCGELLGFYDRAHGIEDCLAYTVHCLKAASSQIDDLKERVAKLETRCEDLEYSVKVGQVVSGK